jgi:hypothetical protein
MCSTKQRCLFAVLLLLLLLCVLQTFVDNHDTGSTQAHWPFPHDKVGQGYAYILTHPGMPCIFWDHFFEWGDLRGEIESLLQVRVGLAVAYFAPNRREVQLNTNLIVRFRCTHRRGCQPVFGFAAAIFWRSRYPLQR